MQNGFKDILNGSRYQLIFYSKCVEVRILDQYLGQGIQERTK